MTTRSENNILRLLLPSGRQEGQILEKRKRDGHSFIPIDFSLSQMSRSRFILWLINSFSLVFRVDHEMVSCSEGSFPLFSISLSQVIAQLQHETYAHRNGVSICMLFIKLIIDFLLSPSLQRFRSIIMKSIQVIFMLIRSHSSFSSSHLCKKSRGDGEGGLFEIETT